MIIFFSLTDSTSANRISSSYMNDRLATNGTGPCLASDRYNFYPQNCTTRAKFVCECKYLPLVIRCIKIYIIMYFCHKQIMIVSSKLWRFLGDRFVSRLLLNILWLMTMDLLKSHYEFNESSRPHIFSISVGKPFSGNGMTCSTSPPCPCRLSSIVLCCVMSIVLKYITYWQIKSGIRLVM